MKALHPKWIYLFILSLIWGSSFMLIKKGLVGLTPMQLGAVRIIFTGTFLFIIGFRKIKEIKGAKEWKGIVLTGLLGTFFPSFLFAYAETEIDSAIASILNSLVPLNTILIGLLLFKIKSTKRQVLGVFIGLIGTLILVMNGVSLNPNQNYFYAVLVIIATIMYAASSNIIKYHLQHVNALTIAVGNFMVIMIPAMIVLITSGFFKEETLANEQLKPALLYMVILSLFGTAVAKVLFNKLIQVSTPVFASSVAYLMPVVAVFWGLLDGERFSISQAFSTVIIFVGVYLAQKQKG
ncbi:DMT family transporter [Seonamhaeicola aphaedonensis]|uniref:EamA domain-containing membrane protein RarD n=1 Tax=Seonamhaeicola aphaedonensis TaxID=1461338 RepID=A0A3D9HLR4_9FLAO|nr:EamA family transporter [Seonamhaeicola aphaedonensis]RED50429.1 EamA domain-containing membrane protein RarD [Seonamhaeicola aphaedonensis]